MDRRTGPETGRKRKVWFEMCDGEPFVFAGIAFGTGPDQPDRFTFLTCSPNTVVGAVHPKAIPVILHGAAKDAWLAGDAADALALPAADELMRVIAIQLALSVSMPRPALTILTPVSIAASRLRATFT